MAIDPERPADSQWVEHRPGPPLAEPVDRRRPGRPKEIKPPLAPLLRFKPSPAQVEALRRQAAASEDAAQDDDDDDLRASRGIVFGALAAGLIWAVIGALMIWFS